MTLAPLERTLGYTFRNPDLLTTALRHRSFGVPHNERLEFLGDGVLNCAVAEMLYAKFPNLDEGALSRLRATLVKQDTLHQIAQETLNLGEYLQLGEGEMRSGGHRRPSILADALEAVFGAIHLDHGFASAAAVIAGVFEGKVREIDPTRDVKDAKTRLQEWLQGRKLDIPIYQVDGVGGAAHAQQFHVTCEIPAYGIRTAGQAASRRKAEQVAAAAALAILEEQQK